MSAMSKNILLINDYLNSNPLFKPVLDYYTPIFKKIDTSLLVEPGKPASQ